CIVDRRNEAGPDALDLVRREPTAFEHLRFDRHYGDNLDLRVSLLQHLPDTAHGATGTHSGDDRVDLAAAVAPDLFGRRLAMDLRIRRIIELLRAPATWRLRRDLLGHAQRFGKSLGARRQHELCAEGLQRSEER